MGDIDYSKFKVREYTHWDLFLHLEQSPYIGRCYAAARRADAESIIDMRPEEGQELFGTIVPAWNKAIKTLFNHDWPNVAILGNEWRHLHAHLIPRYFSSRTAYGIEFIDPRPKGNYAPYNEHKKEVPLEIFLRIKDDIKSKL